jgi:hypothetical protein
VVERAIVLVHPGACHHGGHPPVDAPDCQRVLERVDEHEADRALCLGSAPVKGHWRDDGSRQLVLDQEVAHLWPIAVSEHDVLAFGDQFSHRFDGSLDGGDLILRARAAVRSGHGVPA